MLATINKVKKMLETAKNAPAFKYIPSMTRLYSKDWYGWNKEFYSNGNWGSDQVTKCNGCKKYFMEEELFPTVMLDKTTAFFCPDCMVNRIAWCDECGSAFEKYSPEAPDTGLCPICHELGGKINAHRSKAQG